MFEILKKRTRDALIVESSFDSCVCFHLQFKIWEGFEWNTIDLEDNLNAQLEDGWKKNKIKLQQSIRKWKQNDNEGNY